MADKKVRVVNRYDGSVGYNIPDMNNLQRNFAPGEEKEIPYKELESLSYQPGGMYMLRNTLVIKDEEITKELLGQVEPEYWFTKKDVIQVLKDNSQKGMDRFLDMLDFAPNGVLEMVKTLSVELPVNDVTKREAILQKLNFNVDNAIKMEESAGAGKKADAPVSKRRVAETVAAPARRAKVEGKNQDNSTSKQ